MKMKRCFFLMSFFALAFLLFMAPGYVGAAAVGTYPSELNAGGQTFYGDGAVYGGGYLQAPALNLSGDKCLECHQSGGGLALDMRSYLRTGHGNMVVKTTPPPQAWNGANALPYPTDASGHAIDWTTGKVDLGGWCSVTTGEGQFTEEGCVALGGIWTPGVRLVDVIYTIGGWMSVNAPDIGIMGGDLPANKFYMGDGRTYNTCGSCHNAGYKASDYTRPQPFADYSNLPTSNASGVAGSWVLDGIQCERCHDASTHPTDGDPASVPANASSTAICSQCHIRPAAWEGSANPNAATQPTAYPIGASATNFGSHLIGKQFLNSPHGQFTGAYAEIATALGKYNSTFSPDGGTSQGGCDTCHDVHQSTVPEAKANFLAEPIRRECETCHAAETGNSIHPTGDGTPSCVACHMPKPAGGTGLNAHVFRINTDPDYSTFPKQVNGVWTPGFCSDPTYTNRTDCVAAGKAWSGVAASSPDGAFANAVWVDLDLACGQCHGTDGPAHLLSKRILSGYAQGMHTGGGMSATCSDCHSDTTAVHPAGANTPTDCSSCHGTTRAGVAPTVEAACLTCHGPLPAGKAAGKAAATGTASHYFTASQIATYAGAIHAGGAMPSATCTDCHAEIPAELINHTFTKTCTDCHETTQGARPGVKPTSTQACTACHAPGGTHTPTQLAKRAANMHKNVAPIASMELVATDVDPVTSGVQVNIGDTVQVIDTSTDQNKNLSTIKVNWGDSIDWTTIDFVDPGETATHSYVTKGKKTITLTAFDLQGLKSSVKKTVTIVKPSSSKLNGDLRESRK
jgi:hypothetical protein